MSLYEIIQSLQAAKGSLAKQAILNANADNELFKAYMRAVYDPALSYYQTKIGAIDKTVTGKNEFCSYDIDFVINKMAGRDLTGANATRALAEWTTALNTEGRELMAMLIKRSIGGSVGETMVLKAWPGLFFCPPYMRCAGMSPKVKEEYAALPYFFVQTKMDGSFGYLESGENFARLFTRAGTIYPLQIAKKICTGVPKGSIVMGEILVYQDGKPLPRKVSNGLLNSLLQSGMTESDVDVRMVAWDMVTAEEFKAGKSGRPYRERLDIMSQRFEYQTRYVKIVEHSNVTSLEQAFTVNRDALLRGEEGTVWKKPDGIWRDSSSGTRDAVKVKIKFEAEFVVTGKFEGQGKAKGMLGGFNVQTSCGMIANNVGSGFSDAQRKEYWEADTDGWVVTLEANDVIDRTGSATESLFLPIFVERRLDKTVADSRQRVLEQLAAAKSGV